MPAHSSDPPKSTHQPSRDLRLPVLGTATRRGARVRPSRAARWRAIVLITIQVLIILHIVQWLITGTTLSPMEPSESMDTVRQGIINAGAVLFALALLSTLLLGRWFCGWGCHVVMLQDFCGWLLKRIGIRPRPFRARLLMYVPLALALYMFVWPVVYRWGVAPLHAAAHRTFPEAISSPRPVPPWPGFSLELSTDDFWRTFPGLFVAVPFLFICGFGAVYFLGAKGFCTYGCPYGGFFAPLDQFSRGRIRVTDDCHQCGHCTAVCTSNVRVHEEVRAYGMVVDPGCMKCMDCVSVCPNDALYYGFGPGIPTQARGPAPPARWDLTRSEEVIVILAFALVFFGTRGAYGLVPMLMAGGIAICAAFMTWKCLRCFREKNQSFHRFRLRIGGRQTRAGVVFVSLTALVLLLGAHGLTLRVVQASADRWDGRVRLTRAEVYATDPPPLDDRKREVVQTALRRFDLMQPFWSGGIGLLPTPGVDLRRGWLHACLGDLSAAEKSIERHLQWFGPADVPTAHLALLRALQGRPNEAEAWLSQQAQDHPRFLQSMELLIGMRLSDGRVDDARKALERAIEGLEPSGVPPRLRRRAREAKLFHMRRLALLEADWGAPERAVDLLRELIAEEPDNSATRGLLALLLLDMGRIDEAEQEMSAAVDLAADPRPLNAQMREMLESIGERERAARWQDASP